MTPEDTELLNQVQLVLSRNPWSERVGISLTRKTARAIESRLSRQRLAERRVVT